MVNGGAFIFHMCIPCGQTFSFVPWSRSSAKVKVKYQNHIFQKMAGGGISVSRTLLVTLASYPVFKHVCRAESMQLSK